MKGAWVTLATNDSYSLGALVLAHSLKQVGTTKELAILVTPGVTNSMRSRLGEVFNVVQEVNVLDSRDVENLRLLKRPELGVTFTKLHCWRLTQYDKCVFLDADTLVLQNCDELFDREELSAAPDVGWPDCFNSGVFVYRPSKQTYDNLIQCALDKGSFDGGDQGLLNIFFSDWAYKDISKHLPFIYNVCSTAFYSYLPAFKQYGKDVKIIHFIGNAKPWLQYFDSETKKVRPTGDVAHLGALLQKWWDIFCFMIHPNLSPEMSGLAGALAKLTLGQQRSPEQEALEDSLRRQNWEQGNIDYLGKDSFDNIWSKICETLAKGSEQETTPSPPKELMDPSIVQEKTQTAVTTQAGPEHPRDEVKIPEEKSPISPPPEEPVCKLPAQIKKQEGEAQKISEQLTEILPGTPETTTLISKDQITEQSPSVIKEESTPRATSDNQPQLDAPKSSIPEPVVPTESQPPVISCPLAQKAPKQSPTQTQASSCPLSTSIASKEPEIKTPVEAQVEIPAAGPPKAVSEPIVCAQIPQSKPTDSVGNETKSTQEPITSPIPAADKKLDEVPKQEESVLKEPSPQNTSAVTASAVTKSSPAQEIPTVQSPTPASPQTVPDVPKSSLVQETGPVQPPLPAPVQVTPQSASVIKSQETIPAQDPIPAQVGKPSPRQEPSPTQEQIPKSTQPTTQESVLTQATCASPKQDPTPPQPSAQPAASPASQVPSSPASDVCPVVPPPRKNGGNKKQVKSKK